MRMQKVCSNAVVIWIQSNDGAVVAQLLPHHPFASVFRGSCGREHPPSSCKSATAELVEMLGKVMAEMLAD